MRAGLRAGTPKHSAEGEASRSLQGMPQILRGVRMDTLIFVNLVTLNTTSPTGTGRLNPLDLVMQASATVKLVIVVLALMSVVCWFIIGSKLFRLERATRQSNRFLDLFWESSRGQSWTAERLESIYSQLSGVNTSPLAKVFHAGYVELARVLGSAGGR